MAEQDEEAPPPYSEKPKEKASGNTDDKEKEKEKKEPKEKKEAPPEGDGLFGNPKNRAIAMGGTILFYCILAFWWFVYNLDTSSEFNDACQDLGVSGVCDDAESLVAAYAFITLGIIALAAGAGLALLGAIQGGNRCFGLIALVLECVATLFIALGYFIIVGVLEPEDLVAGQFAGIFGEWAIICSTGIVLGVDNFLYGFFNDDKKRAAGMSAVPFTVFGFIAGAAYCYVASEFDDFGISGLPDSEYGCMGAGYLILAVSSLVRLLIVGGQIDLGINPITKATTEMLLASFIIIGGIIAAAGYWGLVDYYDDGGLDIPGLDQQKCWYMATSFFMLIMSIVNALDMDLIKNCKMASAAGAAT